MREATEDQTFAWPRSSGRKVRINKIPEEQSLIILRIERIRIAGGVRCDFELVPAEAPTHPAPECVLEASQNTHHDGVDVLLMETRIVQQNAVGFVGKWIYQRSVGVFVGKWLPELVARGIVIDDVD